MNETTTPITSLAEWLEHLRAAFEQVADEQTGTTYYDVTDCGAIELRGGIQRGKIGRWWKRQRVGNQKETRLNREEYLVICRFLPWYQPPTVDHTML